MNFTYRLHYKYRFPDRSIRGYPIKPPYPAAKRSSSPACPPATAIQRRANPNVTGGPVIGPEAVFNNSSSMGSSFLELEPKAVFERPRFTPADDSEPVFHENRPPIGGLRDAVGQDAAVNAWSLYR